MLLFYPGDNTTVCTKQFCSYRDNAEASEPSTRPWSASRRRASTRTAASPTSTASTCPLLADADGAVAKAYGAHAPVVGTKRAVIIVDEDGPSAHRHDHLLGLDFQTVGDLREALAGCRTPPVGD